MSKGLSVLDQNQNLQPVLTSTKLLGEKKANDLLALIKSPKNKARINTASELEKRVKLHTIGTQDQTTSFSDWLSGVKSYIDPTKYEIFEKLVGDPVPTLSLTETIFDELSKIYEASNPSEKFTFTSDSEINASKFSNYFNHNNFFKKEYYNQLKTSPNSFIIVDTKLELKEGKQQPITYFVDIASVIDVDADRDGNVNYIIFYADKDRIVGIDDTNYYVYTNINKAWELEAGFPSPHELVDAQGQPMTPAFMLYPNFLNASDNVVVNSPLTKSLGDLEWLLFWAVSKRHLDSYASFPIYVSFEEDCTYQTSDGNVCDNGYIKEYNDITTGSFTVSQCPQCSKNKAIGAGSTIKVKAPQENGDPNNLDAVKVIPAEKDSITYVTEEKTRLEQEIYYSILGKTSQPLETFSQSVSQLDLSTESRKAVLIRTKEIVEKVHEKVVYTMCKLMFGDTFTNFYKNYGDNYFLTTPEQEAKKYADLKNSGAPESMLHATLARLIATTYKTSPHISLLQEVYLEVEPHQTKSIEQVQKLFGAGLISRKDTIAKTYFTDFIEKYESENSILVGAIENGDMKTKQTVVAEIKKQLYEFTAEIIKELDEDNKKIMDDQVKTAEQMPDLAKPSSTNKRKYDRSTKDNQD